MQLNAHEPRVDRLMVIVTPLHRAASGLWSEMGKLPRLSFFIFIRELFLFLRGTFVSCWNIIIMLGMS